MKTGVRKWLRLPITARLLVVMLGLTFVSMLALVITAFQIITSTGDKAQESSFELGEIAVEDSTAALTALGEEAIEQKAVDVARQVQIFVTAHPTMTPDDESALAEIAVQPVGKTGYTFIYDRNQAVMVYHVNPELIGIDLRQWAENFPAFWEIFESGLSGQPSKGYYDWEDQDGLIREKYMYAAPVAGTQYMLAATTYIDEFSTPVVEISQKINEAAEATSRDIATQEDLMRNVLILAMIVLMGVAGLLAWYLARRLSRPILALSEGARRLGEGQLEHRVEVKTGDEIEELAEQFNAMAATLQESHNVLEQRVEERTRAEKQRSEQLRAINKVSQRIISLMSLDDLLPFVVNSFQETFGYYCVSILLLDEVSGQLQLRAMAGPEESVCLIPSRAASGSVVQRAVEQAQPIVVGDVTRESGYSIPEDTPDTKSELAVPIRLTTDVMGVLDIKSANIDAFDDLDVFTAGTLADFVAIVIENAHLYQNVQEIAKFEERNRLAREIHDTLAQGFIGVIIQLEVSEQLLEKDMAQAIEHLERAKTLARDSLNEARRSVWELRPPAKARVSLPDILRQEAARSAEISGTPVKVKLSGRPIELSADVEESLLRIFQEAINNARRHAKASAVEVSLSYNTESIKLTIQDNGIGFDTRRKKPGTFGLIGMRERVKLLKGTINIKSRRGQGTTIVVTVPTKKG